MLYLPGYAETVKKVLCVNIVAVRKTRSTITNICDSRVTFDFWDLHKKLFLALVSGYISISFKLYHFLPTLFQQY